jgi:MmpS family membrane protein
VAAALPVQAGATGIEDVLSGADNLFRKRVGTAEIAMKSHRFVVLLVFAIVAASCDRLFGPDGDIEYRVEGTATTADITYINQNGATTQVLSAPVPWNIIWSDAKKGDLLSISAAIVNGGTITVVIRTNGDEYKKASSSGVGGVATASGTYQP